MSHWATLADQIENSPNAHLSGGAVTVKDRVSFYRLLATQQEKTAYRTHLHRSGPFNSTMFTDCCGLAVTRSEAVCPKCRMRIFR